MHIYGTKQCKLLYVNNKYYHQTNVIYGQKYNNVEWLSNWYQHYHNLKTKTYL